MKITFLGHSCFFIEGEKTSVLIDPYDPERTFGTPNFPNLNPDITLSSHNHFDHNATQKFAEKGSFVIFEPGDYEIKGVLIQGLQTFHDSSHGRERGENTVFVVEVDGVKIVHLGDLGEEIKPENFEELSSTDILMIPVGGVYTIDAVQAARLSREFAPKILIPMHYREDGKLVEIGELQNFQKEVGEETAQKIDFLKISKKDLDLMQDQTKLCIFNKI